MSLAHTSRNQKPAIQLSYLLVRRLFASKFHNERDCVESLEKNVLKLVLLACIVKVKSEQELCLFNEKCQFNQVILFLKSRG